jgi:hypothetical protein
LPALAPPCSVDIFFIDWEKPRKVLAKGAAREEGARQLEGISMAGR